MKHISRRSKIAITVFGVLALVGALAAVVVPSGIFSHAAAAKATTTTFTGKSGSTSRTYAGTTYPKNIQPNLAAVACSNDTDIAGITSCSGPQPGGNASTKTGGKAPKLHKPQWGAKFNGGAKNQSPTRNAAPHASGSSLAPEGGVKHNFNGISDVDSHTANGFHVTPPDQALCASPASVIGGPSGTTVVFEGVNEAWTFYTTNGTALFPPLPLTDLFNDPGASGDITCRFDSATQTYFFAEIGVLQSGPDAGVYGTDLAILNHNGFATYQIDTSESGNCFPDFPQQGFDAHAWYLTIDEFCGPNEVFAGTSMWAFSKPQLVAESATVNYAEFDFLSLGGDPVLALQPAFGSQYGTEYLVNSFPYDQFGNNNSISNQLGLWEVHGDQNITSGSGTVTLIGRIISSETYAFPVPAASTGNGTTPSGSPAFVISEPFLNPDDSRMEQVQLVSTSQGLRLYTSLDTALTIGSDPSDRDGAAWFVIDPKAHKVTNQGYIGVAGTYLLYPSILRGTTGTVVIDFSLTSPTLNPSTGYVYMKDTQHSFGNVQITGLGSGPHVSFSDLLFGRPRWGDYSAASLDPDGRDIWVADEYIPPPPEGTDPIDNWGTRVWDVVGSLH